MSVPHVNEMSSTYSLETSEIGGIECASETSGRGANAFHQEGDTEGVEALSKEVLK